MSTPEVTDSAEAEGADASSAQLTPQALAWLQALGLAPVFVRRDLLRARSAEGATAAAATQASAATDPLAEPTATHRAVSQTALTPSLQDGAPASPAAGNSASLPSGPAATAVDPERAARISRMDWAELDAAAQACRACKLGSSRFQAVFGTGSTQAQWMIVGEAPGAEEDRQGEPFVGAAGKLLDAMLQAIGLDRGASDQRGVYIANVLKCRPPGNRNPAPEEVAQCAPLLQRQVALLQPRIILALGRFAAQSLLGSAAPISQLRGHVHRYAGIPVVVSYHPAYLLRNPADKARVWRDLCFARDVMANPPR